MYSKETENLKLPQWTPKDHPDFLTDMNDAMLTLDKTINDNIVDFNDVKEQVEAISDNMLTIQDEFKKIQETVDALEAIEDNPIIKQLQTDVETANNAIEKQAEILAKNTTDITNIKTTISVIESNIQTIQNDYDVLKNTVDGHTTDIANIQANITAISNNVTDMGSRVTVLEGTVLQHTADIQKLQNDVKDNRDDIDLLKTATGTNESGVSALVTRVSNAEKNIKTNSDSIAAVVETANTNKADLGTLTGRVDTAESDITQLKTDKDNLQKSLDTTNSTVETLQQGLNTTNTAIETLETKHDTDVSNLQTNVNENKNEIDVLNGLYTTTNNKVEQCLTETGALDQRVEALEDGNNNNNNEEMHVVYPIVGMEVDDSGKVSRTTDFNPAVTPALYLWLYEFDGFAVFLFGFRTNKIINFKELTINRSDLIERYQKVSFPNFIYSKRLLISLTDMTEFQVSGKVTFTDTTITLSTDIAVNTNKNITGRWQSELLRKLRNLNKNAPIPAMDVVLPEQSITIQGGENE